MDWISNLRSQFDMDPNPPLTAKQAALLGAKADKPPFNPEADRRHVIASIIRRAGEATGNSQLSAEAAGSDEAAPLEMFDAANESQTPTTADWPAPVDSSAMGDLSLARIVAADQAASRGFAVPPIPPGESPTPPPLGSSMDALQSRNWITGAFDPQADRFGSQPALPELARFIDASMAPDVAPSSAPTVTPGEFPSLENFQDDASALGDFSAPPMDSMSPPNLSDFFLPYDTTHPGRAVQLPHNLADKPAGEKIQLFSRGAPSADTSPPDESRVPITYVPFAGNAAAPNGVSASRERRQFEVATNFADVNKDVTVALLALKSALLKVIDEAGEQDWIDALHREASRRACL
jgi:hypothetical protein